MKAIFAISVLLVSFQGQFIGVVGKVGSGKSSLLAAITAEMEKRLGEVFFLLCTKYDSIFLFCSSS